MVNDVFLFLFIFHHKYIMDIRSILFKDPKNTLILSLVIAIVLMMLGFNVFFFIGNFLQILVNAVGPIFFNIIGTLGFIIGTIVTQVAGLIGNIGRLTVNVAENTTATVGNAIQSVSTSAVTENMENETEPVDASSPIVRSTTQYCLIGEFNGDRGCAKVNDGAMCMSGQLFPKRETCLNAALTPNIPLKRQL